MKTFAKLFLGALALTVAISLAVVTFVPAGQVLAASDVRGGPRGSGGRGRSEGVPLQAALTALTADEQTGLQNAILEEYGAQNLYNAVIAEFGSATPFDRIVRSEAQHVSVLVHQAEKYGVEVPANPGLTTAPDFATLAEACQAGVDAEIADAAMYDDLIAVTTHSDLIQVYTRLQSASLYSHLPAFETCAP
jgi:hypothetical protein